jgi:dihydroorotase
MRETGVQMLIIKGGRVIDPAAGVDRVMSIVIDKGKVVKLLAHRAPLPPQYQDADEIDVSGKYVVPGLIDIHVHLREPGHEHKETIATGCSAAAAGGFTAVVCMPNTDPVNDSASVTEFILRKASENGGTLVYPAGAITAGQKGETLAEMGGMKAEGVVAFTDDGRPVMNSGLMRRAMEYAGGLGIPIVSHCEDLNLKGRGQMNEGRNSTRFGLRPIPAQVEEIMVSRDIALSELTGTRLHIAHVSAEASLRHIRAAKKRGLPVTAETAPHYLFLTDEIVGGYNTFTKVNPPLRSDSDVAALRRAISDGTIDAIATDHAPHSPIEKEVEYELAAPGISGLETSLGLILRLVREEVISLPRAVELMSTGPAKVLGLPGGTISENGEANLTVIDPDRQWVVDATRFRSKGKNTPFAGEELQGCAVATVVRGKIVFRDGI